MTDIRDMVRRTKTYIAGDWDGDKDAINQLLPHPLQGG